MHKFQNFIDQIGGVELAKQLGVSKGTISHWRSGRFKVKPSRCREIERLSNGAITVHDIRPDVFGEPSPREAA